MLNFKERTIKMKILYIIFAVLFVLGSIYKIYLINDSANWYAKSCKEYDKEKKKQSEIDLKRG